MVLNQIARLVQSEFRGIGATTSSYPEKSNKITTVIIAKNLFFAMGSDYIDYADLSAIAINGHRNKPFGPGGGTRRLHHLLIKSLISLRLK